VIRVTADKLITDERECDAMGRGPCRCGPNRPRGSFRAQASKAGSADPLEITESWSDFNLFIHIVTRRS
jgi:hypothetical protein